MQSPTCRSSLNLLHGMFTNPHPILQGLIKDTFEPLQRLQPKHSLSPTLNKRGALSRAESSTFFLTRQLRETVYKSVHSNFSSPFSSSLDHIASHYLPKRTRPQTLDSRLALHSSRIKITPLRVLENRVPNHGPCYRCCGCSRSW
jgi:hypothetical protein